MTDERPAPAEVSLAMVFTGTVYDAGSGPMAEFQITNRAALIEGISARSNLGATFFLHADTLERRIARLKETGKPCEESERALNALHKPAPR